MALTGELSDLSLAELIEFFCNQRKTGRLTVMYPVGAGYFYLKSGAVIHAQFGDLRGIDAIYYALTQPNASFTFSPAFEAPEHTINQPWTSVVLEGLRRMDEGLRAPQPSPGSIKELQESFRRNAMATVSATAPPVRPEKSNHKPTDTGDAKTFGVLLSSAEANSFAARRRWSPAMVVVAVVLLVAVIGVPWALYSRKKAARFATEVNPAAASAPTPTSVPESIEPQPESATPDAEAAATTDPAEIAKRLREARARERAKEQGNDSPKSGTANSGTTNGQSPPSPSNKRATVYVTYDENGRVIAASGGDPTALRIARQKRFPPGKPGSATITIPIN